MFVKLAFIAVFFGTICAVEKPCCLTKKWTAKMRIVTTQLGNGSAVPVITENILMVDTDLDMKMTKVVGERTTKDGSMETTHSFTVYHDYRQMKEYSLIDNSSSCQVEMNTEDQSPACVPSTLQHVGTFRIGSSNNGVMANAWMGMFENFHFNMLTTVDDCTPISMTRFGTDAMGTRVSESTAYADVDQYMTSPSPSPSPFTIPDECKHGDMAVGK